MDINGSVALVTGSSRGLGRQFALDLLERGASKVYATARNAHDVDVAGAEVLALDITDPASVTAAAAAASDVTLLINNAGTSTGADLLTGDLSDIRRELDVHFWGTLTVTRAFAPVLRANGGGAVLNVLSALPWFSLPGSGAYSAGKAAAWNLTNGIRLELAEQGTLVTALHLGAADTDMSAGYDGPKVSPAEVVRVGLDAVQTGQVEALVDDWTRWVKAGLAGDPGDFYAQLQAQLAAASA